MVHPLPEFRSLRLALVSETFPPEINGVAMTLGRLVEGLARRGHQVQVVRCRRPNETPLPIPERVSHLALPSLPIPRYQGLRLGLPAKGRLRETWTRERPDIVHIATEGPLGRSALRAAEDLGLPISSSFHTNFDDYAKHYRIGLFKGMAQRYLRRFHNQTRVTMVPSVDLIERLAESGYTNLVPLGRGVDTELFTPAKRDPDLRASWGARPEDPVLLHVGRVAPEKNLPLALAAFQRIRRQNPAAQMIVVGDGPLRASLAAQYPEVRFTGALPVADLARHYASADVFLFPSMSETFGNVLLEALASGLATVSFAYAAPLAYVRHGENGQLIPFGDEPSWTSAACALATDRELIERLRAHARGTALGIGWDAVIDRYEGYLRQVADGTFTASSSRLHQSARYRGLNLGGTSCTSPTSPATSLASASASTGSTVAG